MDWSVAEAKQRLSELIRRARTEPQLVFRRRELVAVVMNPDVWERLRDDDARSRKTLADSAAEVRRVLESEDYQLTIPERADRANTFSDDS
jgi:PHD/YefM family antitoxin component YafN of YafNO toxin-antitoxin module